LPDDGFEGRRQVKHGNAAKVAQELTTLALSAGIFPRIEWELTRTACPAQTVTLSNTARAP